LFAFLLKRDGLLDATLFRT